MFDPATKLLLGLISGIVFGFLLQKGRVAKHGVIVGQFLFRDFTMVKVMLTAIVVGGLGIHAMVAAGAASLAVKAAVLGPVIVGAAIFGVGMAVLGYCPGTSVCAIAEGSRDAVAGFFGMIFGAAIYAEAYPWLHRTLFKVWDLGKVTFMDKLQISPWWLLGGLALLAVALFYCLETCGRGKQSGHPDKARHATT